MGFWGPQSRADFEKNGYEGGGLSDWLFGGDATQNMRVEPETARYQRGYLQNDFMKRGAPQQNTAQSDATRNQQQQLAGMLMQQASGQRQGAGEMAVQRQANNAMANQTSAAQMSRGANAALAQRNASRANADIGVNAAGQAGIAQMQDQQSAQNQLGGLLGTQRQQDIGVAGANQQSQLAQQQQQLAALAQMLGVDQATLQADLEKRKLQAEDKGSAGSLAQGFGTMMAMSDRDAKTDISDADVEVDRILLNLEPKAYSYKDEKHGKGRRVGIMAQDLERTELGASIVEETPEGKMLDVNKALSLALAAVARLDARVRELEQRG
jgi:hypothetical protein